MRSWLFALCVMAFAGPVLAQGVTAAPDVPRLDDQPVAHAFVFNEGGMAMLGTTCFILRVEPGEIFSVGGSVPNFKAALELVDGARCMFGRETAHLPRLTGNATAVGGMAQVKVDRPGFYSVRMTADGATREARGIIVAARPKK